MYRNVIPPDDPRPRPLYLVSWDREHVKVSGCGPLHPPVVTLSRCHAALRDTWVWSHPHPCTLVTS